MSGPSGAKPDAAAESGPLIYPMDRPLRIVLFVCAAGFVAFGGALLSLASPAYQAAHPHLGGRTAFALSALIPVGIAICVVRFAMGAATVLYPDRVETRYGLFNRSMRRADIKGLRPCQPQSIADYVTVFSKTPGRFPMTVYRFNPDAAFDAWFEGIPNIDTEDAKSLASDPVFGADARSRAARLQTLEKLTGMMNLGAGAIMLWGTFVPQPYDLAVFAEIVLPLVGAAIVFGARGAIIPMRLGRGGGPHLSVVFGAPVLALGLRAMDLPVVALQPAKIAAGLAAAAFGAMAWFGARSASRRPLDVAAMVIVGGIYGYGASICLDRLLDRAPPAFHIGVVVDRFIAGGRSKQYEFRIQAYGHPEGATLDFVVSKALFDAGADGDEVCVAAHPGALHMPWYNLTPCARQTSQR